MASKLLGKARKVRVRGTKEFNAADHFRVGLTKGVSIAYLNSAFRQHFLPKIERNVEAATLRIRPLLINSGDPQIIAELGDGSITCLVYLWELLKRSKGKRGPLPADSSVVIFHMLDENDENWTVHAYCGYGWHIYAYLVKPPLTWLAGSQIISR